MKLKYYMRGLGIGILLTTILFFISGTKEKLTDKEIISRASELGMVMQENQNVSDVLDDISPEPTTPPEPTENPKVSVTPQPTITPEATATPGATSTPEPTKTPEATKVPEITEIPEKAETPKPTEIPLPAGSDTDNQKNGQNLEVSFTINGGMSSGKVAMLLYQVGLIDDPSKFNEYVVKIGKEDVIRVGSYTVTKGSSYDEIIRKITK